MRILWFLVVVLCSGGVGTGAMAEPFRLEHCAGQPGIGIANYVKIEDRAIIGDLQLTELCWDETAARLQAVETSRDLEKTSQAPGLVHYQRLAGGSVSPLNERLQLGDGESPADGPVTYLRWTTEASRTRDELGGNDYVTIEGFVGQGAGATFDAARGSGRYAMSMQLTGQEGPAMAMVFSMFLPVEGALSVEGDALSLSLDSFFRGMGPGEVTMDAAVTRQGDVFSGTGTLAMTNELLAGAPEQMWKRVDLRLDHFAARFAGADGEQAVVVAGYSGTGETFGGESFPVSFTLVGQGARQGG